MEIECIGVSQAVALTALQNAGISAEIESYNHSVRSHWKITTDSSVSDGRGMPGIEVVSPILRGEAGLAELRKVADALNVAGATANRSCGLHVHVGADDLSLEDIKTVVRRYTAFESVIDTFMPQSRRGDNNTFCKSMSRWSTWEGHRLTGCDTLSQLRSSYFDRYYKINLAAFIRQGTLEFRQHSGTVQADKITNWVRFVVNFVETSRVSVVETVETPAPAARRRGRPAGRTNAREKGLFKILKAMYDYQNGDSSERPTISHLARISGYSEASIPACMSEIRRKWSLGSIRKNRYYGYYSVSISYTHFIEIERQVNSGVPATVAQPVVRTTTVAFQGEDSALRGLPASVVSYFNERAAELAA